MKRKILLPIDPEPEEPSRDLEQELKEAQAKIKQLETVLNYGVEMQKMVPRFEYMVLEAKVEQLKFEAAQAEEKMQAAIMLLDLPQQLQFMEPTTNASYRSLSERWRETYNENLQLKKVLRNLRETAERLRVPIDEELLEY